MTSELNIIIPTLNEEVILLKKKSYYEKLGKKVHLIFVDGGSTDRTRDIAQKYGEVFCSDPGKSIQKNFGVQKVKSEYILFLHVDTFLDFSSLAYLPKVFQKGIGCGCFTMKIQDQRKIFRMYEWAVNMRAKKFSIMDGDLGMFITRTYFNQVGGFDKVPIMEDIIFAKKARKIPYVEVSNLPIYVSSRKWDEEGFVKTFLLYLLAHIQGITKIPFFKFSHGKRFI